MTASQVKAAIKHELKDKTLVDKVYNNGDSRSFSVYCAAPDYLKVAFAVKKAGYKRTDSNAEKGILQIKVY